MRKDDAFKGRNGHVLIEQWHSEDGINFTFYMQVTCHRVEKKSKMTFDHILFITVNNCIRSVIWVLGIYGDSLTQHYCCLWEWLRFQTN